jgi:hypothetical protein
VNSLIESNKQTKTMAGRFTVKGSQWEAAGVRVRIGILKEEVGKSIEVDRL